jgi:hypothetical protein
MVRDDEAKARELVQAGSVIAGDMVGAGIGLIFGGPAGAVLGAGAGSALGAVASEFAGRVLGKRERERTGAVIAYAAAAIGEALGDGAQLRDDGFFVERDGRSSAREIAEGVALAARDAFEERKLPFLGNFYASAALDPALDAHLCAAMLRDATSLSWRQYTLLAAVGRSERLPLPGVEISLGGPDWATWGVRFEFNQLYEANYFAAPRKETPRARLPLFNLTLRDQRLASRGMVLHHMLNLDEVPDHDVLPLHDALALMRPGGDPAEPAE